VTIRVTDNGVPALNAAETITITVNEVNVAPVLGAIGNKTVNEGSLLTFTASATDSDVPANSLTYSLDPGAPAGASINPTTGVFSWTPTEAQGPGSPSVTIRVTDNGVPALNAAETITITVNEVNAAPVLDGIGNKSLMLGNMLNFTATATDSDLPTNTLTYSLDAGAPAGAIINPTTGAFAWTPTLAQTGVNTIIVRVTDNGVPGMSDTETVSVTVGYGICALYDQTMTHKKGSTIPVKFNLCDAAGNNVSSEATVVKAINIVRLDGAASPFLAEDSGNANPDLDFRYAGGSYIFNLSTKSSGFVQGTWAMQFVVNGVSDPSYVLRFGIK
jgi:hypothetical protein